VSAFIRTTFQFYPSIFCQKNYLKFSLQFPAGDMQQPSTRHRPFDAARIGSTIQGSVSLRFSFRLHYFSAPSEHFLPKELSQIFAPIPGGSHEKNRITAAPSILLGPPHILA
jgi:hypothetical protein